MNSIPAYEREPYQTSLEVEILATGEDSGATGRAFAVLDDTVLFPEGGGQPADHGHLGSIAVLDVRRVGGEIRHYLAAPAAAGPATLHLDWRRRFDHMQQHTAQHLVTAVAVRLHGWRTTSFHLQPEVCDVELDAGSTEPRQLEALEEAVNAEVRAARPVTARRVSPDEVPRLEVRSRGLPAGHRGDVRLVEIEGVDLNTCGGTHLRSTAEIETVKLLGAEPARGGTRLRWIAGGRVRRRLAQDEARLAELRRLLDTADDKLVSVAGLKLEQLKQASRDAKWLTGRLAESAADALVSRHETVAAEHFDGVGAGFLKQVALRFSNSAHPGAALLTAAGAKGSFFVVAAGSECGLDVQRAGRRVAAALDARGGGSGRVFQGKAESLARRSEALEVLMRSTATGAPIDDIVL
ncbi:MAG: alanyl-tRNA editing protein [Thermoanaerobaculia bacterium]